MIQLLIPPELEDRLLQEAERSGETIEALVFRLIEKHVPPLDPGVPSPLQKRRAAAIEMMSRWTEDDPNVEDSVDPDEILRSLDANRKSDRPLFPPALKGKTW